MVAPETVEEVLARRSWSRWLPRLPPLLILWLFRSRLLVLLPLCSPLPPLRCAASRAAAAAA